MFYDIIGTLLMYLRVRKLLECGKISMKAANLPSVFWSGNPYPGNDWTEDDMIETAF